MKKILVIGLLAVLVVSALSVGAFGRRFVMYGGGTTYCCGSRGLGGGSNPVAM